MSHARDLLVGDDVRCACHRGVQRVLSIHQLTPEEAAAVPDGERYMEGYPPALYRIQTDMNVGRRPVGPLHYAFIRRPATGVAAELGGTTQLELAWKDADAMQVLVDALLERAILSDTLPQHELEEPEIVRDFALLALEVEARRWILDQVAPLLKLESVAERYPSRIEFRAVDRGGGDDGRITKFAGTLGVARLLRGGAIDERTWPRPVLPIAVDRRAARHEFPKDVVHYGVRSPEVLISVVPWVGLVHFGLCRRVPSSTPTSKSFRIDGEVRASSPQKAREEVERQVFVEAVVMGSKVDDTTEAAGWARAQRRVAERQAGA